MHSDLDKIRDKFKYKKLSTKTTNVKLCHSVATTKRC